MQDLSFFEQIVADIANDITNDIILKFSPLELLDTVKIETIRDLDGKNQYIDGIATKINHSINDCPSKLLGYYNSYISEYKDYSNDFIDTSFLNSICRLFLLECYFDAINDFYLYVSKLQEIRYERYVGEVIYNDIIRPDEDETIEEVLTYNFINLMVNGLRTQHLKLLRNKLHDITSNNDTNKSQLNINKKERNEKLESHDAVIVNMESFNEIEQIVCSNLGTSICNTLPYELKFLAEYLSGQFPQTENRDIIIDYIKMEIISFKKIMKRCPKELTSTCENYLSSLVASENKGIYCRIEDCISDARFFLALNFSNQIKKIAKRFTSVDDVKDLAPDFWESLLNNEDPLIQFKQNLLGNFVDCITSIKWNHDLSVIVKKFNKGHLDLDSDFQAIDLIGWGLIDDVDEEEPYDVKDEIEQDGQEDFVPNENILENNNPDHSNEILSDGDLKIVFDILDNLKITSENIYILGDRKKSSIRAVLDVLVGSSLIPSFSITKLCFFIGEKINANIKSLPENDTYTYKDYVERAKILTSKR